MGPPRFVFTQFLGSPITYPHFFLDDLIQSGESWWMNIRKKSLLSVIWTIFEGLKLNAPMRWDHQDSFLHRSLVALSRTLIAFFTTSSSLESPHGWTFEKSLFSKNSNLA